MSVNDNLDGVIRAAGFTLARQRKHRVYKNDAGKTLVVSSTPSDCRSHHNALSQLSRLTGIRKHDLLNPRRRRSGSGAHSGSSEVAIHATLSPEAQPQAPVTVTATPELAPAGQQQLPRLARPMSRAETNLLKRLQKHEAQKDVRHAKQRERLETMLSDIAECMYQEWKTETEITAADVAFTVYEIARHRGFCDCEIMVATERSTQPVQPGRELYIVRAGRWYLDLFARKVYDVTHWENEYGTIEVFGALRVVKHEDGTVNIAE